MGRNKAIGGERRAAARKKRYRTPEGFSDLWMFCEGDALTGLLFDGSRDFHRRAGDCEERDSQVFRETRRWLDAYFAGRDPGPAPKHRVPDLTPFRRDVLAAVSAIPFGATATYGDVAKAVSAKRGGERVPARAVGGAVGWNPLCIMIPCHRVVGADGALVGYGGGLANKVALLAHEGADLLGAGSVPPTEKEKMLRGEIYDANNDAELAEERGRAKALCHKFNQTAPGDAKAGRRILRRLLGRTHGDSFAVMPSFWCDYGYNIEIGRNFFANHNTVILDCAKVVFGDDVFVGPNCGFYTAGHPLDEARRRAGLEYAKPISVGDGAWIGGGVTVCPGVAIGAGAVIAAGAVVTRDIPPRTLAAGVPAKVVKAIGQDTRNAAGRKA